MFAAYHLRVLGGCHPINDWHRVHSNKRLIGRFEYRAINIMPIRIWSVEYNNGFLVFGTSLHRQSHGADISVKSCADILNIINYEVNIGQIFGSRLAVTAVKRYYRHSCCYIEPAFDVFARIGNAAKTMLGCKNFDHIHA